MRKTILVLAGVMLLAGFSTAAEVSPSSPVQVEKIAVGNAIDQRELAGEATQFKTSSGELYCWTKISSSQAPLTIKHNWYFNGQKESSIPLTLASGTGRTWSKKEIRPGKWRVEVTDAQDKPLASTEFTVLDGPATPTAGQ